MRKFNILAILAFLASASALSATTGSLTLEGTVDEVVSISVTAADASPSDATFSGLDLSTAATNLNVASVNEQSNSNDGYRVKVTYDGLMEHESAGGVTFGYTLVYNGANVATGTDVVVTDASGGVTDVNRSVGVTYTAAASTQLSGNYSDVVNLSIESK